MPEESEPRRRVRIVLAAKLRADWSAVVEVPSDTSDTELVLLVDDFFHHVEMDEYVQDDEFWGKGECGVTDNVDDRERTEYRAIRDADGQLTHHKVPPHADTRWCVVHGEAFVPEMFETRAAADAFKAQCDDYVSGPWEVSAGRS